MSKQISKEFLGILGLDNGYGVDKYAFRDIKGDVVFGKIDATIAQAPIETKDMPLFEGNRYYLDDAAKFARDSQIIDVIEYKDHEKFLPLSIWHALNTLAIKKEDITTLAIGLSLAQKDMLQRFAKRASRFTVNGEKFDFSGKVLLLPQGMGAKYAIEQTYFQKNKEETYAIFDIGQLTIDIVTVIGGKVREENAFGKSHDGVIKITQDLQEYIRKEFSRIITLREAQTILNTGVYTAYSTEHPLNEIIKEFKTTYTKFFCNIMMQREEHILKKFKKIFIVGGGTYYLNKADMKKILGLPDGTITIPENPEYLNAIGNLYAAEINEKQKKEREETAINA